VFLVTDQGGGAGELAASWQVPKLRRALVGRFAALRLREMRLGPDRYFVIGDDLANSVDSRAFGPISLAEIEGKVLFAPPAGRSLEQYAATRTSGRS
jgi:hypothetical protein